MSNTYSVRHGDYRGDVRCHSRFTRTTRGFMRLVLLSLALLSMQASAARLLLPEDLPAATGPASVVTPEPAVVDPSLGKAPSFGVHFGVAAGVGAVGVPLGFLLANLLGNLNIYLIPTAIFGLVPMGLVAPVMTALAAWMFGNWNLRESDGRYSFWLGFAAAAIVHIAATVVAGFLGVSLAGIPGLLLFSVVDGVAMSAATVGVQRFFRRPPAAAVELRSFVPAVSATTFVPLSSVSF